MKKCRSEFSDERHLNLYFCYGDIGKSKGFFDFDFGAETVRTAAVMLYFEGGKGFGTSESVKAVHAFAAVIMQE